MLFRITEITSLNGLYKHTNRKSSLPCAKLFSISHFCVIPPGLVIWSLRVFISYHFLLPALLRAPWPARFPERRPSVSQTSCRILSRCTLYDSCSYMFLFNVVFPHYYSMRLFSSVTHSRPALSDRMNCSTSGLPVHHQPLFPLFPHLFAME